MERHSRSPIVTFYCGHALATGDVRLEGSPVQHARARRVNRGDAARVTDGKGHVGWGQILSVGKNDLGIAIASIENVPRPLPLDVIVPVADRDRMLAAAEKCVELQVSAWHPAYFARSRSVSSRGEGVKFREKLKARMESALEQSGGAWMPEIHEEQEATEAIQAVPASWSRFLLDARGKPLASRVRNNPIAFAVGPEGGLEQREILGAEELGWTMASIAETTLRFETAVIAGAAVVRAAQLSLRSV